MTDHHNIIRAAADAVEAYNAWDQRTKVRLRTFNRRAKEIGGRKNRIPADSERAKLRRERREYLARHPQPRTADDILSDYCGDDMRLWTLLCGEVTAEVARRGNMVTRDLYRPRNGKAA